MRRRSFLVSLAAGAAAIALPPELRPHPVPDALVPHGFGVTVKRRGIYHVRAMFVADGTGIARIELACDNEVIMSGSLDTALSDDGRARWMLAAMPTVEPEAQLTAVTFGGGALLERLDVARL